MEGIEDVEQALFVLNDDVVMAHQNEFRMGHRKLFAVGSPDHQRLMPHQLLAYHCAIHGPLVDGADPGVKAVGGSPGHCPHACHPDGSGGTSPYQNGQLVGTPNRGEAPPETPGGDVEKLGVRDWDLEVFLA